MKTSIPVILFVIMIMVLIFGTVGRRSNDRGQGMVLAQREHAVMETQPAAAAESATKPQQRQPVEPELVSSMRAAPMDTAAADSLHQEWVRIPGTSIPIWPKPSD